jgi:hypothetical protein
LLIAIAKSVTVKKANKAKNPSLTQSFIMHCFHHDPLSLHLLFSHWRDEKASMTLQRYANNHCLTNFSTSKKQSSAQKIKKMKNN